MVQDSAIGQYLSDNPDCAYKYRDSMFTILGKALLAKCLSVLVGWPHE